MRLMQAGKYTAAAPSRVVEGSLRSWARGIGPGTDGMRSSLTTSRAAAVRPVSGPDADGALDDVGGCRPPYRASFSAVAYRRAILSAAFSRWGSIRPGGKS